MEPEMIGVGKMGAHMTETPVRGGQSQEGISIQGGEFESARRCD